MSNEEQIDWLCRLRSWLTSIGMPNEWRSNFDQVLADVIYMLKSRECYIKFDAISREKVLECLKKKLKKVCLNAYSTKDSKGCCQIYKRKDFCEWSMEAYERGEDYFYADPVNPVNPYGKHKLCEPRYAYELVGMLSKEEYEELFGVVSEDSGDKENDEKEE